MQVEIINNINNLLSYKREWDFMFSKKEYTFFQSFTYNYYSWKNILSLNKGNVLNSCKQELSAVEDLIEFSEYLIDNHKQPDPKISQLLILIKSIIEEPKPTLIFAHYIATLDSAYRAIVADFSDKTKEEVKYIRSFLSMKMYNHDKVKAMTSNAHQIISSLFKLFIEQDEKFIKEHMKKIISDKDKPRAVCDFIAGMTDNYAQNFYNKFN